MDINATLIGQMITFALFVWFTMKYVWPLLEKTLKARQQKIAEGLAAAERGHKELELAWKFAVTQMREARDQANKLVDQAKAQAALIVEEAKRVASQEREKILDAGFLEIERERKIASQQLQKDVVTLAIASAEKLLKHKLTDVDQQTLLDINKTG